MTSTLLGTTADVNGTMNSVTKLDLQAVVKVECRRRRREVSVGLCGVMWGCVGDMWSHVGLCGLYEVVWGFVGLCGVVWGCVGLSGVVWGCVGLCGVV